MRNALRLCIALVLALPFNIAEARIIGTNPTGSSSDLWCNGGRISGNTTLSSSEICQDSSGNWIPTTTATQDLGTPTLKWRNLVISGTTTSGSQTIAGNEAISGSLGVGSLTAPTTSQVALTALTASTTGQIIVTQPSATADALDFISNATLTAAFAQDGQFLPLNRTKAQIDALIPRATGALIICTNCTIPFSVCTATGTLAAQWARAGSSTVGCGTNN